MKNKNVDIFLSVSFDSIRTLFYLSAVFYVIPTKVGIQKEIKKCLDPDLHQDDKAENVNFLNSFYPLLVTHYTLPITLFLFLCYNH